MEEKLERADPEQPTEKILVVFSPEFCNELFPRPCDVKAVVIVKGKTVVTLLSVFPLFPKERGEQSHIRKGLQQALIPFLRQQPLWIDPGVRLLGLKSDGIDGAEPCKIEVRHQSSP
jgi:hypothetical protein